MNPKRHIPRWLVIHRWPIQPSSVASVSATNELLGILPLKVSSLNYCLVEVWVFVAPTVEGIGRNQCSTTSIRHGVAITNQSEDSLSNLRCKLWLSTHNFILSRFLVSFFAPYNIGKLIEIVIQERKPNSVRFAANDFLESPTFDFDTIRQINRGQKYNFTASQSVDTVPESSDTIQENYA